jgi:hypothetical protein
MRTTAFPPASVTGVMMADILNRQMLRRQRIFQFLCYGICGCHVLSPAGGFVFAINNDL